MLDFPESSEHKETMPLLSKCRSKRRRQQDRGLRMQAARLASTGRG